MFLYSFISSNVGLQTAVRNSYYFSKNTDFFALLTKIYRPRENDIGVQVKITIEGIECIKETKIKWDFGNIWLNHDWSIECINVFPITDLKLIWPFLHYPHL